MKWAHDVAPEMEQELARVLNIDLENPPRNWSKFIGKGVPEIVANLDQYTSGIKAADKVLKFIQSSSRKELEKMMPEREYSWVYRYYDGLVSEALSFDDVIRGVRDPKKRANWTREDLVRIVSQFQARETGYSQSEIENGVDEDKWSGTKNMSKADLIAFLREIAEYWS
jgi:hypothetical protein